MEDKKLIEKINLLTDVLSTRVRYMRAWNAVTVSHNETLFTIRWYEWMGEPSNTALFQEITYPLDMLSRIITEQKNKLKKDIPDTDKNVLRLVL